MTYDVYSFSYNRNCSATSVLKSRTIVEDRKGNRLLLRLYWINTTMELNHFGLIIYCLAADGSIVQTGDS
jgi:hypothetical protein